MPELKQPETLWKLCLMYVQQFYDKIEEYEVMQSPTKPPFSNLSWIAKNALMEHFYEIGLCVTNSHIQHILHPWITNLEINLHVCSIDLFQSALSGMKRLKSLTIKGISDCIDNQEMFFPFLESLQHLMIHNCLGLRDKILKSISVAFPRLTKLDIRGIKYTQKIAKNLDYLWYHGKRGCAFLHELYISRCNKTHNLTHNDIIKLFLQHPNLVHVTHPSVFVAIHFLVKITAEEIKAMFLPYETKHNKVYMNNFIKKLIDRLPLFDSNALKTKAVQVNGNNISCVAFYPELQTFYSNILSLKLVNNGNEHLYQKYVNEGLSLMTQLQELVIENYAIPCLDSCNNNLKSLVVCSLIPLTYAQILHILKTFTSLRTLCIDQEYYFELNYYENNNETWLQANNIDINCLGNLEHLKHLKLGNCEELPAEFCQKILLLENLETLCLSGSECTFQLRDNLFTDKCLQNVCHLCLEYCNYISMDTVCKLLSSHNNKIFIFYTEQCYELFYQDVEVFMEKVECDMNKHLDIFSDEVGILTVEYFLSDLQKWGFDL